MEKLYTPTFFQYKSEFGTKAFTPPYMGLGGVVSPQNASFRVVSKCFWDSLELF